jgi:membrane-bound lytic murein transglycosylase F
MPYLYNKYFHNRHAYRNIHSEHYALGSGKHLQVTIRFIKEESERHRLGLEAWWHPWSYQESRFNPEGQVLGRSLWTDAADAPYRRQYRCGALESRPARPDQSGYPVYPSGSTTALWMRSRTVKNGSNLCWQPTTSDYGHIQDARRLAEKSIGADPMIWQGSVEEWLLKKSDPKFYTDKVVKYGYARGIETYNYVRQSHGAATSTTKTS